MIVRDHGSFIAKDNAHLALDSDPADAYILVNDGMVEILGNVTASLSGSTDRNSGLIEHGTVNYGTVLISGSSDLRTRTTTGPSTAGLNAGFLTVADSTGFNKNDFISVYDESIVDSYLSISPDGNNDTQFYQYGYASWDAGGEGTDGRHSSSSFVFPRRTRIKHRDHNEQAKIFKTWDQSVKEAEEASDTSII